MKNTRAKNKTQKNKGSKITAKKAAVKKDTDTAKRVDTKVQKESLKGDKIKSLLYKYKGEEGGLITLLQKLQEEEGYLSRARLELVAQEMNLSLAKVMGIVTFYSQFHLVPKGQNIIRVCMGTACHVKGSAGIMDTIQNELGVGTGETTSDGKFSVEAVSCIGACGLAPVITVNHETYGKLSPNEVLELLDDYKKNGKKRRDNS